MSFDLLRNELSCKKPPRVLTLVLMGCTVDVLRGLAIAVLLIKDYVRIGKVTCTEYDGQSMTNTLQNDHHKWTEAISTRSC